MLVDVHGNLVVNGVRDVSEQQAPPTYQVPPTYRPLPIGTTQLAGQAAGDVVSGLAKSPWMLGIVVINLIGIVAAVYFLNLLIGGQQKLFNELMTVQQAHLKQILDGQAVQYKSILDVHNREFDALVDMAKSPSSPQGVPTAPVRPAR